VYGKAEEKRFAIHCRLIEQPPLSKEDTFRKASSGR
jgi:hypothetical protein